MDLGDSIGRAAGAARQGDLDSLEIELVQLRRLGISNVASISIRFRAMARSVREHPSFREMPRAQAV